MNKKRDEIYRILPGKKNAPTRKILRKALRKGLHKVQKDISRFWARF